MRAQPSERLEAALSGRRTLLPVLVADRQQLLIGILSNELAGAPKHQVHVCILLERQREGHLIDQHILVRKQQPTRPLSWHLRKRLQCHTNQNFT